MKPVSSQLIVPNRMEYVNAIIVYVLEIARNTGFDEKEISQIHLAVEEAVTNVIRHGLEMNPEESFTVICEQSNTGLSIRIQEKGLPFDPNLTPIYSPDTALEHPEGLGMFLMKKSMDEVHYINRGAHGMETCLVKHLEKRRIGKRLSPEETKPFEKTPRVGGFPKYTIREFVPDDAFEVSRCAYRAYGYSYNEYIYFPEKIIEYNQDGTMFSFVAITETGNLVGHMALKFPHPGASIGEISAGFTKPAYRRLGLAKQFFARIVEKARMMKLTGILGRPVTSHTITQKLCLDFGLYECGIFFGFMPGDMDFKSLVGKVRQRESWLLAYMPLDASKAVTLFPPTPYRAHVGQLYARMNIPFNFSEHVSEKHGGKTSQPDIRFYMIPSWNVAAVEVIDYGGDDFGALRNVWRRLCLEKVDVIYLYLNMEDPRCAGVAEKCRSVGFFFAGVLPNGAHGSHALILQFLNNWQIEVDQINLYSKESRELLQDIVADAPDSIAADGDTPDQ